MTITAKKALVKGTVQGVFFRATTREKALSLDIKGYAKNLVDGSVEVLAIGSSENVEQLVDWLWTGSPASKVNAVTVMPASADETVNTFTTA